MTVAGGDEFTLVNCECTAVNCEFTAANCEFTLVSILCGDGSAAMAACMLLLLL